MVAAATITVPAAVASQEGVYLWRFQDDGDAASLYTADTAEGTDALGPLSFSCKKKSGVIGASVEMEERTRFAFADLIGSDRYPRLHLVPDDPADTPFMTIRYSEMNGWMFGFSFNAASAAFERFVKTGSLQFKISGSPFPTVRRRASQTSPGFSRRAGSRSRSGSSAKRGVKC